MPSELFSLMSLMVNRFTDRDAASRRPAFTVTFAPSQVAIVAVLPSIAPAIVPREAGFVGAPCGRPMSEAGRGQAHRLRHERRTMVLIVFSSDAWLLRTGSPSPPLTLRAGNYSRSRRRAVSRRRGARSAGGLLASRLIFFSPLRAPSVPVSRRVAAAGTTPGGTRARSPAGRGRSPGYRSRAGRSGCWAVRSSPCRRGCIARLAASCRACCRCRTSRRSAPRSGCPVRRAVRASSARSPAPLPPKQIRPALTAHLSTRPLTPMLPSVSWPSRQQPCSMPRSFCAQRLAGRGGGAGLATAAAVAAVAAWAARPACTARPCLRSACRAASSVFSSFRRVCASSSAAFRAGVGSGGGGAPAAPAFRAWSGGSRDRPARRRAGTTRRSAAPAAAAGRTGGRPATAPASAGRVGVDVGGRSRPFLEASLSGRSGPLARAQSAAAAFFGPSAAGKTILSSVRQ